MLIPHLHICGDCEEAIALYEKAFITKAESVIRNSDYAPVECKGDYKIAHATMKIKDQMVYLNDRFGNPGRSSDCAVHMITCFNTAQELLACYEILKEGSILIDPLEALPYSKLAVQFIDKFGVQWGFMVVN